MGHLLGYARVSITDQQPQLQVDALEGWQPNCRDIATPPRRWPPGVVQALQTLMVALQVAEEVSQADPAQRTWVF